jgi:hypothetical protein
VKGKTIRRFVVSVGLATAAFVHGTQVLAQGSNAPLIPSVQPTEEIVLVEARSAVSETAPSPLAPWIPSVQPSADAETVTPVAATATDPAASLALETLTMAPGAHHGDGATIVDAPEAGFNWSKVPRGRPMPRLGNFPILPTGPGYYSLLDALRGDYLQAPPKYPYPRFGLIPPSFFDVDNFSYLDKPNNTEHDFFDCLKRIHIGDNMLFVTGGDVRSRYENQYNFQLTHTDNNFEVSRARVYGDLWYRDDVRLYAEYIGAWVTNNDLAGLPIDENKADFLNLFMDFKIFEGDGNPGYVRVGRQELLLGSQRMVSTLDWANTRRTFQGVRGFRTTEKFDVDLFWAQPVIPNPNRLDSVDNNVNFAGVWTTYRPKKGQAIDAYYLMLDNTNRTTTLDVQRAPFTRHTFGGRYYGENDGFLWDAEYAMQLGTVEHRNLIAGMATTGVGYNWNDAAWNPTVWAYYDYASGGNPNGGTAHTFNPMYPFGHYYIGWLDVINRQNIHDLNFHVFLYPTKWLTSWFQFHSIWLADNKDALYSDGGVPIRRDASGRAGSHVGEEIDYTLNFHLSKHADILCGYSYLWGGDFLQNTSTAKLAANASFFFAQYSYRW